jgi:hypothetical protein
MNLIAEADRLGFHSVGAAEAYGSDAITPLAYIAARTERIRLASGIMQMPARTPAMAAMTAMSLDQLSGGRFICGLGVSGSQVVEAARRALRSRCPHARVRRILRTIWARERALEHHGEHYDIPYTGAGASGSASRSRASSTGGRSRSTSRRSGRRASRRRPRSPTAGCRSSTPRIARRRFTNPRSTKDSRVPAAARARRPSTSRRV